MIDAGEVYPNVQPHKEGRVGIKLELTIEIETLQNLQKDKRQIGYSRACTCIRRGVRNHNANEYHAPILFSYWYVQRRFIFET